MKKELKKLLSKITRKLINVLSGRNTIEIHVRKSDDIKPLNLKSPEELGWELPVHSILWVGEKTWVVGFILEDGTIQIEVPLDSENMKLIFLDCKMKKKEADE